jgi:2-dehydro-3-deoxyglucarate aldolase
MVKMMNLVSRIKKKLESGEVSLGTWMQLPNPSIAEILGQAGYDWVAVDMEHGHFSKENLANVFRGLELGETVPLVRLSQSHPADIKQALDAGAGGIILPNISESVTLERCIQSAYYPPQGHRGVGYSRANLFGKRFNEYASDHVNEILIIAQIEDIEAVKNLDDILQVGNLNGIIVGPYDLSGSMGITGQFDHPDFEQKIAEIASKAKRFWIPMGIHIVLPDEKQLNQTIDKGYQFIAYGTDAVFLYQNAQNPLSI